MSSTITTSAERELEGRAKLKLVVLRHAEEVSGSVTATCRYYGITRTCFYKRSRSLTRFPGRFLCVDHAADAAGM